MQVGFKGGPVIEKVDTAIGMNNFFSIVKKVVVPARKDLEWPIFFDRFYKRYLRENEFDKIKIIIDAINEEFSKHPTSVVSDILELDSESKDLMLSEYYIKYFKKFNYCYYHASPSENEVDYEYIPFQIFVAEMPSFMTYCGISLAQFDALPDDALPIWLTGELP